MKHCMYCDTLMARDAVFCPKCGRKQSKYTADSSQPTKQQSSVNLNATPPVEMSNMPNRDIKSKPIAEYKRKMGLDTDTSHCAYATLGSAVLRSIAGQELFGLVGSFAGNATVGKMVLSVEKNGILLMGLTPTVLHFNGKNKFIKNSEIDEGYTVGNTIHLTIHGQSIKIKMPLILIGMSARNRPTICDIINKRYDRSSYNQSDVKDSNNENTAKRPNSKTDNKEQPSKKESVNDDNEPSSQIHTKRTISDIDEQNLWIVYIFAVIAVFIIAISIVM